MSLQISEQERIRRESLVELEKLGIDPYPSESFEINTTSEEIHKRFQDDNNLFQDVQIAGRLMGRRIMGSASFAEFQDSAGRIQLYFNRDEICPGEDKAMYNTVFKRLLDIGDIIGVKGHVFVTKMGEITIHVKEYKILCKSLRPLPVVKEKDGKVYDAFRDAEQRYRQRYLDLIVNPDVRDTFRQRARMIQSMREVLMGKGLITLKYLQ